MALPAGTHGRIEELDREVRKRAEEKRAACLPHTTEPYWPTFDLRCQASRRYSIQVTHNSKQRSSRRLASGTTCCADSEEGRAARASRPRRPCLFWLCICVSVCAAWEAAEQCLDAHRHTHSRPRHLHTRAHTRVHTHTHTRMHTRARTHARARTVRHGACTALRPLRLHRQQPLEFTHATVVAQRLRCCGFAAAVGGPAGGHVPARTHGPRDEVQVDVAGHGNNHSRRRAPVSHGASGRRQNPQTKHPGTRGY